MAAQSQGQVWDVTMSGGSLGTGTSSAVFGASGTTPALPMAMAEQEFLSSWTPAGGQQCTGNDKAFNACKFARHDAFNNP